MRGFSKATLNFSKLKVVAQGKKQALKSGYGTSMLKASQPSPLSSPLPSPLPSPQPQQQQPAMLFSVAPYRESSSEVAWMTNGDISTMLRDFNGGAQPQPQPPQRTTTTSDLSFSSLVAAVNDMDSSSGGSGDEEDADIDANMAAVPGIPAAAAFEGLGLAELGSPSTWFNDADPCTAALTAVGTAAGSFGQGGDIKPLPSPLRQPAFCPPPLRVDTAAAPSSASSASALTAATPMSGGVGGPQRSPKWNHGHVSKYTAEEVDVMQLWGGVDSAREILRSDKDVYQAAKEALSQSGQLCEGRKKVLTQLRRRERAAVYTNKKRAVKRNQHAQLIEERNRERARVVALEQENATVRAELQRLQAIVAQFA